MKEGALANRTGMLEVMIRYSLHTRGIMIHASALYALMDNRLPSWRFSAEPPNAHGIACEGMNEHFTIRANSQTR